MSLEGQFKALEGNSAVDDELAKMKGQVRLFDSAAAASARRSFAAAAASALRSSTNPSRFSATCSYVYV